MTKQLYKIHGTLEVDYYIFVRAGSVEEAAEIGSDAADAGAWTAENGQGAGDWQTNWPVKASEDAPGPDDTIHESAWATEEVEK